VTQIALLDTEAHRTLRVQTEPSARYGDDKRFVPVAINEFSLLVVHYPILLSKDAETGAFYCGAMLGFDEGENLFLDEGRNVYRPLNLQRGPFYTAGSDVAIDLDHPRVGGASGELLFTPGGKPTPYLEGIMELMRNLRPGLERTKVFVDTLLQLKLVAPLSIDAQFDDGTHRDVYGLYTIDQEALRGLADAPALELFRRGYLQLIYLMLASLKQVPVLAQKKNRRLLA
jgi:SapC